MTIRFKGLIAPVEVPTGDGRMFAAGKMTHRPTPLPLLARFSSGTGGHDGAMVIGKITNIYDGPGGYWADGEFLDPEQVPEVVKAIYMIQEKVMGPSVDLDRDFTVEAIKHPLRAGKSAGLFKEYNIIGVTLVPMPAFSQVHLSVENQKERVILASVGVDTSDWAYFDVNGESWKSWPIAPREYTFDADDAVKRIAFWAGIGSRSPSLDRYASTFLWRNGNQAGPTLAQDSFRLPLADIINGEPHLIYHAVYAAAALLSGGHGGLPNIPNEDKQRMVPVINEIYAVLAQAYGDKNLKSPFLEGVRTTQAAIDDSDCGCELDTSEGEHVEEKIMTNMNTSNESLTIGGTLAQASNIVITFADNTVKEPYGDVKYADPGYRDGVKRYPIDTPEHIRAAWAYINVAKNARFYNSDQLERIKNRIKAAAEEAGIEISEEAEASLDSEEFATAKEPYGDVKYADPGYQDDGVKRYPLDSEKHCRAAWSYINMPKNAAKYSPEELKLIRGRIKAALKKYGVEISEDEGQMVVGMENFDQASLLASIAPLAPPADWFTKPAFKAPTKLTITEDGRIFGHLAQWKVCHVGVGNKCVIAPKSKTNYQLFRVGTVVCDDGTPIEIGKITLGTGHANDRWGVIPSREHYDNTGWAAAIVNVGEDRYGIWVSGALTTTMTQERIAELRRSPLSGDWREVNGNLELIAALAVNNPGFPIYREQNGRAFSLMAVGIVGIEEEETMQPEGVETPEIPSDDVQYDATELSIRQERLAAIEKGLDEHFQAKRAEQLAEIDADRQKLAQSTESNIIARQMNARFVEIKE